MYSIFVIYGLTIFYTERKEVEGQKKLAIKLTIFRGLLADFALMLFYVKMEVANKIMILTASKILMVKIIELKHQDLLEFMIQRARNGQP